MLIAAAFCPHPPVLVPEAAGCAAPELDDVRAACDGAVAAMMASRPDLIVTVGGAARGGEFGATAAGSLAGYGVAWRTGAGVPVLPLSLTIGRWLLERAGVLDPAASSDRPSARNGRLAARGPGNRRTAYVRLVAVGFSAPTAACLRLGAQLARRAPRVALLVMGDGSARRSEKAPGFFDPRAQRYDDGVAAALAEADAGTLSRLDPRLSADMLAAGRAAWQVLAGAAGGEAFRGRLYFSGAPYGVCYLVASWTAAADAST